MRIFPIALIVIGVFGVLRHFGLIDPTVIRLLWPFLVIAIGVGLLLLGPRCRGDWRGRMHDRWERRMHRHFGPGWDTLSEEERERFRAGMQQWRDGSATPASTSTSTSTPDQPR
ncbi:MAG: DUF5668 domain-containing protein [Burkholderiales bacterium]